MIDKFCILVSNPNFVNPSELTELVIAMENDGIKVYRLNHHHATSLPFYIMNSSMNLTGVTKK